MHLSSQLQDSLPNNEGPDAAKSIEPDMATFSKLQDIKKAMEMLNLYKAGPAKTTEEALKKKFNFWETQPVPKLDENPAANEPIEQEKTIEEIRPETYPLPTGFTWDTLNIDNEAVVC